MMPLCAFLVFVFCYGLGFGENAFRRGRMECHALAGIIIEDIIMLVNWALSVIS